MGTSPFQKSESFLSKRRLGLAGVAAFVSCVACCTMPLLLAAGLGGGMAATLSSVFRPGLELFVGAAVFLSVLGAMAIRGRLKRKEGATCGAACRMDGSCCNRGASPRSA